VHRSLGEQHQDGGTDITATTTPASAAPPTAWAARAEAEAGTESARTEATAETPAEAGPETWAERAVVAGVVTADVVAELATGLPALLVQCTPGMRVEAETLCSGTSGEFPFYMGEWVVHMSSRFWKGSAGCATDTLTIYRKLS
jgi:hypothetical protein